ncbi:hypothetical protein C5167_027298 [Papaver somniferum]|nr:hypothetical protein C5167_027298 [Papaver somniferum]
MVQCSAFVSPTSSSSLVTHQLDESTYPKATSSSSLNLTRRLLLSNSITCATSISYFFPFIVSSSSPSKAASITEFVELEDSGGVKSLDLRTVMVLFPWLETRFRYIIWDVQQNKDGDSIPPTDHKDEMVHQFLSLSRLDHLTMRNTSSNNPTIARLSEHITRTLPPKFFDRQRLFTTIFNPTRLANGEGSTLGILIFDIELLTQFFYKSLLLLLLVVLVQFLHYQFRVSAECTCEPEDEEGVNKSQALKLKFNLLLSFLLQVQLVYASNIRTKHSAYIQTAMFSPLLKSFAAGVILATGFIHILPDAFDDLTSPCLKEHPWHDFPFTGFIAMVSAMLTLMADSSATGNYRRSELKKKLSHNRDENKSWCDSWR